jgi:hypothetical protein
MTWKTIEELATLSDVERLFWLTVLEPMARVVEGEAYLDWEVRNNSTHRNKLRLRCNGCGSFTAGKVRDWQFGKTSALLCLACGHAICLVGQVAPFRVRVWVGSDEPPPEAVTKRKAERDNQALGTMARGLKGEATDLSHFAKATEPIIQAPTVPPPEPRPNVFAPPVEASQRSVAEPSKPNGQAGPKTPLPRKFSKTFKLNN